MTTAPRQHHQASVQPGPGLGWVAVEQDALLRAGRGDLDAFALLYDRLAGQVFGMTLRVVGDHAEAEEVVQEVWRQVWQTAPRYEPEEATAVAWVMTLAHRRIVELARDSPTVRAADVDVAFDQCPGSSAYLADADVEQRVVRRCLSHLAGLQRQSILLAYFSGRTYHEAADELGAPLGTVRIHMRDGLIRLRDGLHGPTTG